MATTLTCERRRPRTNKKTGHAIRLVVADDHCLFLDGLLRLLNNQEGLEIVGVATNGAEAVAAVKRECPDILLLDISMPDCNAFAVADRIQAMKTGKPRIILLTMHNEPPYIIAASRPDIQGFVLKNTDIEELVQAIRTVHAGQRYFGTGVSHGFLSKAPLSGRELEVLRCAANGMTTQDTSVFLGISVKTVETHRSHIMRKLDAPNITTAVHLMDQRGI